MNPRRHATTAASGLALLLVPILLSARAADTNRAATEPPAPTTSPTTSVPATTVPVDVPTTQVSPASTSSSIPGTDGEGGQVSTTAFPVTSWPQIGEPVIGCITPWGGNEPSFCDPRVELFRIWNPATQTYDCYVTPAGERKGRTCPTDDVLPETAAGSRWA